MPGRTLNSAGARFGFNGQEKVNEINGVGNHNTALFWEYDTRLGRRWNLDPVSKTGFSDYSVVLGNPIRFFDVNGDDTGRVFIPEKKWKNVYKTHLKGIAKNPGLLSSDGHIYLDYDPLRSNANKRRRDAKKGFHNPMSSTHDIDEFPYASTKQGGVNAAVNLVPLGENRSHGGYLGSVVKIFKMKEGDVFDIVLIPDNSRRNRKTAPKSVPKTAPQLDYRPDPERRVISGYPGAGIGNIISGAIEWLTGEKIPIPDPVISPVPVGSPSTIPALIK